MGQIQETFHNVLNKIAANQLTKIKLPANTQTFLQEVGLPNTKLTPIYPYVPFEFLHKSLPLIQFENKNYLVVGYINEDNEKLCIVILELSGEVYLLDLRPYQIINRRIFINSDIIALVKFLVIYQKKLPDVLLILQK